MVTPKAGALPAGGDHVGKTSQSGKKRSNSRPGMQDQICD
jgi:hypothetical protein